MSLKVMIAMAELGAGPSDLTLEEQCALNPPVDLKPSIIFESISIESEIFANLSKTSLVVFFMVRSYDFVISIKTPSQSKIRPFVDLIESSIESSM